MKTLDRMKKDIRTFARALAEIVVENDNIEVSQNIVHGAAFKVDHDKITDSEKIDIDHLMNEFDRVVAYVTKDESEEARSMTTIAANVYLYTETLRAIKILNTEPPVLPSLQENETATLADAVRKMHESQEFVVTEIALACREMRNFLAEHGAVAHALSKPETDMHGSFLIAIGLRDGKSIEDADEVISDRCEEMVKGLMMTAGLACKIHGHEFHEKLMDVIKSELSKDSEHRQTH